MKPQRRGIAGVLTKAAPECCIRTRMAASSSMGRTQGAKGEAVINWRFRLAWAAFYLLAAAWLVIVTLGVFPSTFDGDFPRPGEKIVSSGAVPLRITVRPLGNRPIRLASAEAFGDRESAEQTCEFALPPETKRWSTTQQPFVGDDLVVDVPTSRTTYWPHLRTSRYSQHRFVVVILQYQDGERTAKVVDVPNLRKARQVTVDFP